MVSAHRDEILKGLKRPDKVDDSELIESGFDAAKRTIEMMRAVFKRVPPRRLVQFYIDSDAKPKQLADDMWDAFGQSTIQCMRDGVHLLAVLWQSAWLADGAGDAIPSSALEALTERQAMKICQNETFLPSVSIAAIGSILRAQDDRRHAQRIRTGNGRIAARSSR
jgi:hypothetical protein